MKKILLSCLVIPFLTFFIFNASAQTDIKERVVAEGLHVPWEIIWGPDDNLWITERNGMVSSIDPVTGDKTVLADISDVTESSESGLLGMALHPDFLSQSPYVYVAYTYSSGGDLKEKIVRYEYANDTLTSPLILVEGISANFIHSGCRLLFGPDDKLYASTGDAGNGALAQDSSSLSGKILRMNDDGSVPADNPFPGSLVWALGSRNTQGLVWVDSKLYGSEHGPTSDDEVNIYMEGRNYGWPDVVGYCNTSAEQTFCQNYNVVEPLQTWTPTLAVAGIDYYNHSAIPEWQNSLLMTTLKASKLVQLKLSTDGNSITDVTDFYSGTYGRLRDLCVSPDGRVFIVTSNQDGRGTPIAEDDRIIELKGNSTSAELLTPELDLQIYPNPASDKLQILAHEVLSSIELYNVQGELVEHINPATQNVTLNTAAYARGVYVLKISAGDRQSVKKVVLAD